MKKEIFVLVLLMYVSLTSLAQSVITVQSGNTTSIYYSFDAAVAGAQSGDYIYLPGGYFSGTSLTIDKRLTIIGAGYHPDSSSATNTTSLNYEITFTTGSDSSFLSGVKNSNVIWINTSNITLQRCLLERVIFGNNNYSNIRIIENIIQGTTSINCFVTRSYSNCIVSKNIIYGDLAGYNVGNYAFNLVNFQNNIFTLRNNYFNGSYFLGDCSFENNIFLLNTSSYIQTQSVSLINNNLFISGNNSGFNTTNRFNEPLGNIFMNYTQGSTAWDHTQNFHLKPGCNGIGLGTDGTDVGVYGTTVPFKEGGLPFNPHFQSISIPNSTNANGTLDINIQVKAQTK